MWDGMIATSSFAYNTGLDTVSVKQASLLTRDHSMISPGSSDDGASNWEIDEPDAHGLYLSYDTSDWTVTAVQSFYPSPYSGPSTSQGSMQVRGSSKARPWIY